MKPWRLIVAGSIALIGAVGAVISSSGMDAWAYLLGLAGIVCLAAGLYRPIADHRTIAKAARDWEKSASARPNITVESEGNSTLFVPPPLDD